MAGFQSLRRQLWEIWSTRLLFGPAFARELVVVSFECGYRPGRGGGLLVRRRS